MPSTPQLVRYRKTDMPTRQTAGLSAFGAALLASAVAAYAADYPIPVPTPGQNVVQVVNESPVTVLIGVFGPTEVEPRENHWDLAPGGYLTFDIPLAWRNSTTAGSHGPRFWARTGCRFDKERDIAQCETGECGGFYDCGQAHLAGLAPTTLAEWCFNCGNDFNYWDVSAVDGVNLSMDIQPLGTYSSENPKSPGDTFWCRYPNAVQGADLRGTCPAGFQLKRSDLGSFIMGDEDGVVACFSNCGKYEYPVAPSPTCLDSDPSCYAWKQFCCNAPPSEYGKPCATDTDCEYGDACWHLPDKSVCACRGYVVDPPCPDDVCTNQDNIAQPPYGTCSEPECIGDDVGIRSFAAGLYLAQRSTDLRLRRDRLLHHPPGGTTVKRRTPARFRAVLGCQRRMVTKRRNRAARARPTRCTAARSRAQPTGIAKLHRPAACSAAGASVSHRPRAHATATAMEAWVSTSSCAPSALRSACRTSRRSGRRRERRRRRVRRRAHERSQRFVGALVPGGRRAGGARR
jgi:hypothetical protein